EILLSALGAGAGRGGDADVRADRGDRVPHALEDELGIVRPAPCAETAPLGEDSHDLLDDGRGRPRVTRLAPRFGDALDQGATLGGEELRRGCEPIALFHQELAALDPLLEGRGDGATAEDVQTQIVDEIESAGRTDVIAAPGNVDAQRGKFVVATAV